MTRMIRIGSRRSRLAQRQAHLCAQALSLCVDASEGEQTAALHVYQTTGDAYLAGNLSDIGSKGLFTKEIEHALLRGDIDIAVHSMKDVATQLPDGLMIPCVLARDDVRDVLLCEHADTVASIAPEATIGTSSLRRSVQIRYQRPDVATVSYRGNLDRRIARLESGTVDATLLAAAGLDRLGITLPYATHLSIDEMLPACAQGAIGLQCRADDHHVRSLLEQFNHAPTMAAITAERTLLAHLDGSCRTPIGGYATEDDAGRFVLHGLLANTQGSVMVRRSVTGTSSDGADMAETLAHELRDALQHAA